jgi:hypothetical protein
MPSNKDRSVRLLGDDVVGLHSVAATGKDEGIGGVGTGAEAEAETDFHLPLGYSSSDGSGGFKHSARIRALSLSDEPIRTVRNEWGLAPGRR